MRSFIGTLSSLLLLMGLLGGCDRKPPVQKADLEPRLNAAMQITNLSDRDTTLKAVATDAADLGVGDIVKRALGGMTSLSTRDSAANDSALRLATAGHRADAAEVAAMITSLSTRDATLKKLGEGTK